MEGEKGKKGRKGRKVFLHFNRPKILRHHLMAIPARTIGAAHSSAVVSFIPLIAACSKQPSFPATSVVSQRDLLPALGADERGVGNATIVSGSDLAAAYAPSCACA